MKYKFICSGILLLNISLKAQISNYYEYNNYTIIQAINLVDDEVYPAAQFNINEIINFQTPKDYLLKKTLLDKLVVDLSLYEKFALSKYMDYYQKFASENEDPNLYRPLANYYLFYEDWDNAINYLTKLSTNGMSSKDIVRHEFKLGYVHFMNEQYSKAIINLNKVKVANQYKDETNYMLGVCMYKEKRFQEVMEYFNPLLEISEYNAKIRPYLIQIYFNNKEYQKAINEGILILDSSEDKNKIEVSKIIGESYFRLKQYKQAIPYLETYVNSLSVPLSADYYQLGYVYYNQKQYSKAIEYFNKIVSENSVMGQNAYFQLGNSYLLLNNKNEALTAYKSASEMNFSDVVSEKSLLNYAKLSYDVGNPFESSSVVIQRFLKKYPKNPNNKQIKNLLVNSYLKTNDYENALSVIKQQPEKSKENQTALEQIYFLKGLEHFNKNEYEKAIEQFNLSMKIFANSTTSMQSIYWAGESQFRLENYSESYYLFKSLEKTNINFPEKEELNHVLGYVHFKMKEYEKAKNYFENYIKYSKGEFKNDAKQRLAEIHINLGDYNNAQDLYEDLSVNQENDTENLDFNKAILFGLKSNNKAKINQLNKFLITYPKSNKTDEVYLELAYAYYEETKYESALEFYNKIINYPAESEYKPTAYLGKADCLNQLGNTEKAIIEYQNIAKKYAKTEYVKRSVEGAKPLFIKQKKLKEFEKWTKEIGYSFSNQEREEFIINVARNNYNENKYQQIITDLEDFDVKFPNSTYNLYSNYLIAESYYKLNNHKKALIYFIKVASKNNENQEDALFYISKIHLENKSNSEALLSLEALYQVSKNENHKSFSEYELMNIYINNNKQLEHAKTMANFVIANQKNTQEIKEKAKAILARINFYNKKENLAKEEYKKLENSKNNSVKAESLYFKSYFLHSEKKYKPSNELIFDMVSKLPSEQYWGAKALVLMADNYFNLKDLYQANFTLEQVLNNYKEFEDVIIEAKNLKSKFNNKL